MRDQQSRPEPRRGPKGVQDRQPGGLTHHRAEGARRSAQDRDRPPAEHPVDVRGRATEPVDGVLEHAGNAVVVLGCEQQQATVVIDGLDAQTSVAHGWRFDDLGGRLRGLVEMLRWISQFIGQPRSRAPPGDDENYVYAIAL